MKKKGRFKGTIIIGDPCEMVKNDEDWQTSKWGEKMHLIGFNNYVSFEFEEDRKNIVNYDSKEIIGTYCTDSCMVCIVYLEELLKYNPTFNQHIEYPDNWTVIKDFDGKIIVKIKDDYPVVFGKGNVNFYTESNDDMD